MRYGLLLIILWLFASPALGVPQDSAKRTEKDVKRTESPQPEASGQKAGQKDQKAVWPRPYRPSEEIKADTTVPFPTDI